MKVNDIMTQDVLTIGPEAEIRDVARIFVERGVSGLPVCGARREILGVISEGDLLFKEHGAPRGRSFAARLRGYSDTATRKASALRVRDSMTAPAITVSPFYSVAEAARLMSEHGINRLPVVRDDELVGIVTRTDLIRAFVRPDEDIRHEIRDEILRRTLWLEVPEAIEVDVTRGSVRLSGRMQTRSETHMLERLVARVPGVVSVQAELSWTTDDTTRRERRALRSNSRPVSTT